MNEISTSEEKRRVFSKLLKYKRITVDAPPGAGKTFSGVYIALEAKRKGIISNSRPAIFLTFSKNARVQIEDQVGKFIENGWMGKEEAECVRVSSYHSFFLSILSSRGGVFGLSTKVRPGIVKEQRERKKELSSVLTLSDEILNAFCSVYCWNKEVNNVFASPEGITFTKEMKKLSLSALKKDRIYYSDFGPMVIYLLEKSRRLKEWLQLKFPLVIIDEFQDTDCCQFEVIKLWQPNLLLVFYDRYQLIYDWRYAREERVDDLKQYFQIKSEACCDFKKIYRVNQRYIGLKDFLMDLRKDDLLGNYVSNETKDWLNLIPLTVRNNMLIDIVGKLRFGNLININEKTGILCRGNELSKFLYQQLNRKQRNGRGPYFNSYLLCGDEEKIEESLRAAFDDLRKILMRGNKYELRSWLGALLENAIFRCNPCPEIDFSERFAGDFKHLPKSREPNGPKNLARVLFEDIWDNIDTSNIQIFFQALCKLPAYAEILAENMHLNYDGLFYIKNLIKRLQNKIETLNWEELLDFMESTLSQLSFVHMRTGERKITIMTVHQSKAREYDHVIIPLLSKSGEPIDERRRRGLRYEYDKLEDRKLLYVAFARSKKRVSIIYPIGDESEFLNKWNLLS